MRRLPVVVLCLLACAAAPNVAAAATVRQATPRTQTPAALRAALGKALARAGTHNGAYVLDLTSGRAVIATRATVRRLPASVEKLYTISTVLRRLGSNARLSTRAYASAPLGPDGLLMGNLYLKGAGDPTFGSAAYTRAAYGSGSTLEDLIRQIVEQDGLTAIRGRVLGDASVFDTRQGSPGTGYAATGDGEGVLTGLAYNRGFANERGSAFQRTPAAFTAGVMTSALRKLRVSISDRPGAGTVPPGSTLLAEVRSPAMSRLAALTLLPSDNYLAEMLLKVLGNRFGDAGTTEAGVSVVRQTLRQDAITPRIVDGSGLSRGDTTSPYELVKLLRDLRDGPVGEPLLAALPTAGRTGTLAGRMRGSAAQDRCHAKTGTLHDVVALAGYCDSVGGHTFAFAFLLNGVATNKGRSVVDSMAALLASYRPRTPAVAPIPGGPSSPGGGAAAPVARDASG